MTAEQNLALEQAKDLLTPLFPTVFLALTLEPLKEEGEVEVRHYGWPTIPEAGVLAFAYTQAVLQTNATGAALPQEITD